MYLFSLNFKMKFKLKHLSFFIKCCAFIEVRINFIKSKSECWVINFTCRPDLGRVLNPSQGNTTTRYITDIMTSQQCSFVGRLSEKKANTYYSHSSNVANLEQHPVNIQSTKKMWLLMRHLESRTNNKWSKKQTIFSS